MGVVGRGAHVRNLLPQNNGAEYEHVNVACTLPKIVLASAMGIYIL